MVIDDKHAHLIANALILYRDQIEDELEEDLKTEGATEYMGGLMTREEYIRDSEATIKEVNELLPTINAIADSRMPRDKVKKDDGWTLNLPPEWKEKLKAKIDSLP